MKKENKIRKEKGAEIKMSYEQYKEYQNAKIPSEREKRLKKEKQTA